MFDKPPVKKIINKHKCSYCEKEYVKIEIHEAKCPENPKNKSTDTVDALGTPPLSSNIILKTKASFLIDEFEQIKTYFRKGKRPSQQKAIETFEKHLKELI